MNFQVITMNGRLSVRPIWIELPQVFSQKAGSGFWLLHIPFIMNNYERSRRVHLRSKASLFGNLKRVSKVRACEALSISSWQEMLNLNSTRVSNNLSAKFNADEAKFRLINIQALRTFSCAFIVLTFISIAFYPYLRQPCNNFYSRLARSTRIISKHCVTSLLSSSDIGSVFIE